MQIGEIMEFIDEIRKIKSTRTEKIREARLNREREEVEDFEARIQSYINDFEKIKLGVLDATRKGYKKYTVIAHVFDVEAPIFNRTQTKVFAHITGNEPHAHRRALQPFERSLKSLNDEDANKDELLIEVKEFDRYECAMPWLLTSEYNSSGFNGRWYFIDTSAGKSVILDKKLIELWELLESVGLRPFFSGDFNKADLCVYC